MTKNRLLALATVAALTMIVLQGCTPATPEEQVAELRARFEARVNGFYVEAVPQVDEEMAEGEAVAEGEADEGDATAMEEEPAAEESEGEESAAEETPVVQNAHLDLILQHDNDEMLPGITVDITMVDANQQEKGSWRLWVDTSTLQKANQLQLVHTIEDVPYVEGDGFAAEIRSPIPPEEYGDYQEFSSLE